MRTTTNINFYCRQSKIGKNGEAPIEICLGLNGKRTLFSTSVKCDPFLFNKKRPQYITKYLDAMRLNIVTTLADLTAAGIPLTTERLKKAIQQGGVVSYTINDLYTDFNKIVKAKEKGGLITKHSANRYYLIEQIFSKYISLDREVTDITPALIERVVIDLQGYYEESSLAGMLTRLKTVIKYAIDNNHLRVNPFQNVKIKKGIKEITTISEEDLEKIRSHTFIDRIQKVADMFVFSCGSGLAFCDCCQLKPSDFVMKDGKICIFKERQKTGIKFYSVLLPWAVEIAKKYNYDFSRLLISNQKTNSYLKEIADICGTSIQRLHFHLARHFYATFLINKKVPISSISKALGHANNSTITAHYARLLTDTIVDDISKAI